MSSLYRKWRSRSFDDLVGQDHVVRTLRNAVLRDRIAHAYLFTGPRGTGKTSTARILAKAMNCLRPVDGNPCNECEPCVAAEGGRAMDVIEIDAASHTSVENVRDLRERVAYAAGEGRYKVYIVDEVHRLSGAAFDAFLKTLEEPPPHVVFVFASTEPHKVPATIMSRCQRFDFHRITPTVILERLEYVAGQEGLDVSREALEVIASSSGGALRDALGLLDQVTAYASSGVDAAHVRLALGLADPLLVDRLSDTLVTGQVGEGLREIERFLEDGGDPAQLRRQLMDYWQGVLLAVCGVAPGTLLDPALEGSMQRHGASVTQQGAIEVLKALSTEDFGSKFDIPPELPLQMGYVEASLALSRAPTATGRAALASPPAEHAGPPAARKPRIDPAPPAPVDVTPRRSPEAGAPSAQAATPASVPGGDVDLAEAWDSVVAAMRARSPSLQAILRSGHLLSIRGGEITVGFLYEFHRNTFSDTKKRKLLEEVVAEVLGVPYRVTCTLTTKAEIAAISGMVEDDGFVEELAEQLREFHARQLGNGSS